MPSLALIMPVFNEEAAIAAVAKSFGALPTRAALTPHYAEARKAWFRKDKSPINLTHEGPVDQAMVAEAAYYRAEKRGFAPGKELDDWLEAEKEIEALTRAAV